MNASITTIKEPDGDILYPKTKTEAVYDNSNNRLDQTLSSINSQLTNKQITNLSIDTTKITVGSYDCVVKAGICFISLASCSFPNSGNIMAAITNAPKAALTTLSSGYGSAANAATLISEYGWINKNQTSINFSVTEANKAKNRDLYFAYPVA